MGPSRKLGVALWVVQVLLATEKYSESRKLAEDLLRDHPRFTPALWPKSSAFTIR